MTSDGAAGIISYGGTAQAVFNNHMDKPADTVDPDLPQTGDTAGGVLYALAFILFGAGVIAAFILHRERYFG